MSNRKPKFIGKINNKTIYDFFAKLDYSLTQEERIKLVNSILHTNQGCENKWLDDYFIFYFSEKFDVNIKQNECLSSENNVCNILELMANYILFADDAEKINKINYNFYTKNQLQSKYGKECSMEELIEKTYDGGTKDGDINFLISGYINYKKAILQNITQKDIKDNKVIKEYEDFKVLLSSKLKLLRINNMDKPLQKRLVKILKDIKTDQIISKDKMNGVIYFKAPISDSEEIDYEQFDMENVLHIIELLQCNNNLLTDLGCLKYDLMKILKSIKFNPRDRKILSLYLNNYTTKEISKVLNTRHNYIKYKISSFSKKISHKYILYLEDWYYTYIAKGKYKKCSNCHQIKLQNLNYFRYNKILKDNLSSWCRKCENLSKLSKS